MIAYPYKQQIPPLRSAPVGMTSNVRLTKGVKTTRRYVEAGMSGDYVRQE